MNCNEVQSLLHSLIDDELPTNEQRVVKKHLHNCPHCQLEYERINEIRYKIIQIPQFEVPNTLKAKISNQIDASTLRVHPSWWRPSLQWITPITTHTIAVLLGGIVFYTLFVQSGSSAVPGEEILAAHVRSLIDAQITQVTSEDTHTVAPWFAGKVDFAPKVRNLTAQGFNLAGGRVDYLKERKVAALVYLRRKHQINVFITPLASETEHTVKKTMRWSRNGYNIVGWQDRDFQYWAISDLSAEELFFFSNLMRDSA